LKRASAPCASANPCLPVAAERADGALRRYNADRVVTAIRNKYVAIGGHHHAPRAMEARVCALPVCEAFLNIFLVIFVVIFLPAASQCADDGALLCH
jgi:hypothetical protein